MNQTQSLFGGYLGRDFPGIGGLAIFGGAVISRLAVSGSVVIGLALGCGLAVSSSPGVHQLAVSGGSQVCDFVGGGAGIFGSFRHLN